MENNVIDNSELLHFANTPAVERDRNWENKFLTALSKANVQPITENPVTGPDNWPYLMVQTTESAKEPVQKMLHWLSTRGVGMAVNPNKEFPDFILTYGMVWSFRETGYFFRETEDRNDKNQTDKWTADVLAHAGTPSETYLPSYVRKILREFFRDQGIYQPKILVASADREQYHLAFSLQSLHNPPEIEHRGICEAIAWFLPPHYSILLTDSKNWPEFIDL